MKLSKKILAVILSALFVIGCFAGCTSGTDEADTTDSAATSDIKVGFIFLHD